MREAVDDVTLRHAGPGDVVNLGVHARHGRMAAFKDMPPTE